MTRILSLFGLMRVREHERIVADNDEKAYTAWVKIATERDDMKMWRDDWQQKHNSVVGKLKMADNQTAAAVMARNEADAKFKKAVADLEKQAGEIAALEGAISAVKRDLQISGARNAVMSRRIDDLLEENDALRPDALAMRRKRQMDRDRRKGK